MIQLGMAGYEKQVKQEFNTTPYPIFVSSFRYNAAILKKNSFDPVMNQLQNIKNSLLL